MRLRTISRPLVAMVALAGFMAISARGFQEPARKPAESPPQPLAPSAGPEHALLKRDVGVWDARVEMWEAPGGEPTVSKGVETNRLLPGGLWLISDFKGEMAGQPFEGHGIRGYDPEKKKYVGTWVDSMTTRLSVDESTYDAATKTMTGTFETPGPDGKLMKLKAISVWKDDNTRTFSMSVPTQDGKEFLTFRITYSRRAGSAPAK
jgi:uncharacterized protein DUF1579